MSSEMNEPAAASTLDDLEAPSDGSMIEAIGLSKYYGQFVAIEQVSFSVPAGQVVAFLGPNGAGKSTTMKLLTGYLAPSQGRALIGGHDLAEDLSLIHISEPTRPY